MVWCVNWRELGLVGQELVGVNVRRECVLVGLRSVSYEYGMVRGQEGGLGFIRVVNSRQGYGRRSGGRVVSSRLAGGSGE